MYILLQKHMRGILIGVVVAVSIPFIFMTGYGTLGGAPAGGGAQFSERGPVVATVGDRPITQQQFMEQVQAQRNQGGRFREYEEMVADGTIEQILDGLIARNLVQIEAREQGWEFEREYLVEQLKQYELFRDDEGNFDPRLWNRYVQMNENADWNALYEQLTEDVRLTTFSEFMTASARVFESDVRRQFADSKTTIRVKYALVQPKVELTEEEIRAEYEADPEAYALPEKRIAQFVSVSLAAPRPAVLDEIMEKVEDGVDFGELVQEYSESVSKEEGGEIGWVTNSPSLPDYQKILFETPVGEVTPPVKGPASYFIFKVDEQRESEVTDQRDVRARQIMIPAVLPQEEREERIARAEELAQEAKESGDLQAVAAAKDLEIQTTEPFSADTLEIDPIPAADTFSFRRAVGQLAEGAISDVVQAREAAYVAEVTEVIPPEVQPFEAVRDQVEEVAVSTHRQTPEYRQRVQELVKDIEAAANSVDEIPELFPELDTEVKVSRAFTPTEYLMDEGVFWDSGQVYETLAREPGPEGPVPIRDLTGKFYFVELVEKNEPDETVWETEWPEERERLRTAALQRATRERLSDYLTHLRESSVQKQIPIQRDQTRIFQLLGLDESGAAESEAAETLAIDAATPPAQTEPMVDVATEEPVNTEAVVDPPLEDTPPDSQEN